MSEEERTSPFDDLQDAIGSKLRHREANAVSAPMRNVVLKMCAIERDIGFLKNYEIKRGQFSIKVGRVDLTYSAVMVYRGLLEGAHQSSPLQCTPKFTVDGCRCTAMDYVRSLPAIKRLKRFQYRFKPSPNITRLIVRQRKTW